MTKSKAARRLSQDEKELLDGFPKNPLIEVINEMKRLRFKVANNEDFTDEEQLFYVNHLRDIIDYHAESVKNWTGQMEIELDMLFDHAGGTEGIKEKFWKSVS